jgi:hypothetical protein
VYSGVKSTKASARAMNGDQDITARTGTEGGGSPNLYLGNGFGDLQAGEIRRAGVTGRTHAVSIIFVTKRRALPHWHSRSRRRIISIDLVVTQMSVSRPGFLVVVAAFCAGGTAHAQAVNPLTYWTPGWPAGFAGDAVTGSYGNFPGFDTRDSRGFGATRYNLGNGFFVGNSRTEILGMSGITANTAFGNIGSLYSEGSQVGYSFKGANGLPVSLYAGFDTLKYNNGFGSSSPFAAFDSSAGNLPVYNAHAGIELRPTANTSLSLGFGYQQNSGAVGSENALPPGANPFTQGVRR